MSRRVFYPELRASHEKIHKFVMSNQRRLSSPYWLNLNTGWHKSEWEEAKLKVINLLPIDGASHSTPLTRVALRNIVKNAFGKDVYCDYSFFPSSEDKKYMQNNGIPICFGSDSHRPLQDFDIVLLSNTISSDMYKIPSMIAKSGVHLYHRDRLKDPSDPFIFGGGLSELFEFWVGGVNERGIFYDDTVDENGLGPGGLIDAVFHGRAEAGFQDILYEAIKMQEEGFSIKEYKLEFIIRCMEKSYHKQGFYYPYAYKHVFEDVDGDKTKRKLASIVPHWPYSNHRKPDIPDKITYAKIKDPFDNYDIFSDGVLPQHEESVKYHRIEISRGCGGGRVCSFCYVGNLTGGWSEKSLDAIDRECSKLRKSVAADGLSLITYNGIYYSNFIELMHRTLSKFQKIQYGSFRADETSAYPELACMFQIFGMQSLTTAPEGISQRIRKYLNKSLTEEQIIEACKIIFTSNFTRLKFYMIFTGLEEEQDFVEFQNMLIKIKHIAAECGKPNFFLFISFACLSHMPNTPLIYLKRSAMIYLLYEYKRWLPDWFYNWCYDNGISIKFNVYGRAILVSQLFFDMGREGAEFALKWCYDLGGVIEPISKKEALLFINTVKDYYDLEWIARERDEDEVFPYDMLLVKDKKLLYEWAMETKRFESKKFCLKTFANSNPKCYSCGGCVDDNHRKWILTREVKKNFKIQDFYDAIHNRQDRFVTRVWINQNDPIGASLSHRIPYNRATASILDTVDGLEPIFNRVSFPRLSLGTKGLKDTTYGSFVYDIYWRDRFNINLVRDKFDLISSKTDSIQIKNIYEVPLIDELIDRQIMSFSVVDISEFSNIIKDKLLQFLTGSNHKYVASFDNSVEWKDFSDKNKLFFKLNHNNLYFIYPLVYNPISIFQMILDKPYNMLFKLLTFKSLANLRIGNSMCSCGEHSLFSIETCKYIPFCAKCFISRVK